MIETGCPALLLAPSGTSLSTLIEGDFFASHTRFKIAVVSSAFGRFELSEQPHGVAALRVVRVLFRYMAAGGCVEVQAVGDPTKFAIFDRESGVESLSDTDFHCALCTLPLGKCAVKHVTMYQKMSRN